MQLDFLVWVLVAGELLILCAEPVVFFFKILIGFAELVECLDRFRHFIFSFLDFLLKDFVIRTKSFYLVLLREILLLDLGQLALELLHLKQDEVPILIRFMCGHIYLILNINKLLILKS